ncbi:zinc finger protein-like 1 homolog isoform X2 [Dreissena polymorpha]|uniref:zinc finger protein-like 1 homolog isoform X2 n=1 Tax=Dreissena polymorpha TaxID=45954 RepID=UPI0022640709|nr:zinc finger protein-like 1 homolog isoform X2 [Dreissena polymorpha]
MGLCKCPKKKVTNLFCFEHRVNVCEHCLVANHDKCIVQSYLQWLQDSDYSPHCALCNKSLSDDTCGQCVRLTCYDVFHFSCLHLYAQALPGNTAPAGYMCPTCHAGIFPPGNMASPVADMLRQALSTVNWARAGLGLPLIEETETVKQAASSPQTTAPTQAPQSASLTPNGGLAAPPPTAHQQSDHVTLPSAELTNLSTLGMSPAPSTTKPSAQVAPLSTSTPARPGLSSHSVISVDGGTNVRNTDKQNMTEARKLFDSTKEDLLNLSHDHDDDKYKRRPAMDWLNKWLRSRDTGPKYGMKKKTPTSVRKKFLVVLLIGIIGFLTLIVIFSRLSRNATDDDPFLDPMANPMIRVHAN